MTIPELTGRSGHEPTSSAPRSPETYYAAYPPFQTAVLTLRREIARLRHANMHKAHLGYGNHTSKHGSGNFKDAYHLPGSDNLMVKLFKDPNFTIRTNLVKAETVSLTRLHGLNDFEQMVASSPEDGAIIVEEFDGIPLEEATDEMVNGLTKDVLTRTVASIKAASDRGIELDHNPRNILIGRTQARLFFLDPRPEIRFNYFEINLITFSKKLASAGKRDDSTKATVSPYTRLAVLKRFREVIESQFPDLRELDTQL